MKHAVHSTKHVSIRRPQRFPNSRHTIWLTSALSLNLEHFHILHLISRSSETNKPAWFRRRALFVLLRFPDVSIKISPLNIIDGISFLS
jgi:hypothetical protein